MTQASPASLPAETTKDVEGTASSRRDLLLTTAIVLVLYSVLCPTWYWVSPIIARVSDLSVLLAAILLAALMWNKSDRTLRFMVPYVAYGATMLLSLALFAARGGKFVGADFVELARPLFWMSGIAIGYSAIRRSPGKAFERLTLVLVIIGWLNSIIAWIMYIAPDFSLPMFQLYSVRNLYEHGRPGGLAYTHTEYVAINAIAILASIIGRKKFTSVTIIFLLVSCIIPQSKAGIVLIAVMMSIYIVIKSPTKKLILISSLVVAATLILWPALSHLLELEFPYMYSGFLALSRVFFDSSALEDGSVGPRAMDWIITWERMLSDPLVFLFGNSPMRGYREISYIENTSTNVLFRFGIAGIISYYYTFVSVCISEKIDRAAVISFICAVVVADCAANFSESIKFMFCLSILFGALLARSESYQISMISRKENVSETGGVAT